MIRKIMASKRVRFGVIFLGILLLSSILYDPLLKEILPTQKRLLFNQERELMASAPFTPIQMPPFGSDRLGVPIFNKILEGAKYTIGLAVFVSFFRVFFGAVIGLFISLYMKRLKGFIRGLSQAFDYIPTIFLAFILIKPLYVSVTGEDTSVAIQWALITYQLFVAIGIGVPTVSVFIASEIDEYKKNEHVMSSIIMGATKLHLIRTHIWLYLKDKLLILFMQNIVQSLILFTHLGILHVFIGGQRLVPIDDNTLKNISLSNEWSGLIGINNYELMVSPWIILSPLIAFFITIYTIKVMTEGIQDVFNTRIVQSPIKKQKLVKRKLTLEKHLFTFNVSNENKERIGD